MEKEIQQEFDKIWKALEKLKFKRFTQTEEKIISLLKSSLQESFSGKQFAKAGIVCSQLAITSLIGKGIIDRKWYNNHYEYYLTEEWNKLNSNEMPSSSHA